MSAYRDCNRRMHSAPGRRIPIPGIGRHARSTREQVRLDGFGRVRRGTLFAYLGCGALSGLLLAAPAVAAEDSIAPPSVTSSSEVHGRTLSTSTVAGRWRVQRPGAAATLLIAGGNAAGEDSTTVALWTSHWMTIRHRQTVLTVSSKFVHGGVDGVVGGSNFGTDLRFRLRGHRWSSWADAAVPYPFNAFVVTQVAGINRVSFLHSAVLKMELRIHLHLSSPSVEQDTYRVQALA